MSSNAMGKGRKTGMTCQVYKKKVAICAQPMGRSERRQSVLASTNQPQVFFEAEGTLCVLQQSCYTILNNAHVSVHPLSLDPTSTNRNSCDAQT
jgi:hypothetical protein